MNVEVAVIPAAGRGTRMLPATRSVPKSFLSLVDRPAIQWIIEEGMAAGAREFIVIVDPGVDELLFSHFRGLEILPGFEGVEIRSVTQPTPRGLGDAVLQAADAVAGRPFYCMLADNVVFPDGHVLGAMAQASDGRSVMCLRELDDAGLGRYGVVVPGDWVADKVVEVKGAVEKPGAAAAPSRLGFVGRYLFTPEVFDGLAGLEPGYGGEVQLTDAINELGARDLCLGFVANRRMLDIGHPAGYVEAAMALGLSHSEFGPAIEEAARRLLGSS